MTYSEQILEYLRRSGENICDDCLALVIPLKYRQQAHSRCSELESLGKVIRARDQVCGRCRQIKIGTRYPGARPHPQSFKVENTAITLKVPTDRSGIADSHDDRPWSWEGNVQSAIATWLSANAWTIRNLADTAARSSGIDIVAECDAK